MYPKIVSRFSLFSEDTAILSKKYFWRKAYNPFYRLICSIFLYKWKIFRQRFMAFLFRKINKGKWIYTPHHHNNYFLFNRLLILMAFHQMFGKRAMEMELRNKMSVKTEKRLWAKLCIRLKLLTFMYYDFQIKGIQ